MKENTEYDNRLTRVLAIAIIILFVGLTLLSMHLGITPLLSIFLAFASIIILIFVLPKKWFLHEKV
jgi:uncharacterized membrane protein